MLWVKDSKIDGKMNGQNGIVNQAAPGLGSRSGVQAAVTGGLALSLRRRRRAWASEEIMGLLDGSEPGMWVRQREVVPHVTQAVPHSAFLGLALLLGRWPLLAQHWSSATAPGRAPSQLPASTHPIVRAAVCSLFSCTGRRTPRGQER